MMNKQFLNDKLIAAKLPRVCLPRHELLKTFDREKDKRVVFVSAPAGYGKTVSTQLWLANSGRETIWIGLDGYDNTPFIFYKLFCTGILSVQPENTAMKKVLGSPSFASSPVEHAIRILSEFTPENKQYALVLDDVHLVTNGELLKSGLLVRKRLPLSFVTLILTRNEVPEEYISTLGEERYAIITSNELAFSVEEIQNYFYLHGRAITTEEAVKAHSLTEGWAIGVNALALSGKIEFGQNGGQILGNYIQRQIWDKWDEDLREFMLKTAVTDEIPVVLCESLTGLDSSREILERLCAAHSFISRYSEDTYCYHHLFLDFLRGQVEAYGIDTKPLYTKAAEYYIDRGEYFIARRFAVKSGDADVMMRVIHKLCRFGSASLDEFASFAKLYRDETPSESVCEQVPLLYAVLMWENYILGNAAKVEYYMDKVYLFLPVIAADFPQDFETVVMQISLDHRVTLSELLKRFAALPPITHLHESQQGVTLTHEMPFLHRSSRDYCELADEALREKLKNTLGQLFKDNCEIVMSTLESGLLLEKNQSKEAMAAALRTEALINESTSYELRFCAFVHLTAVYYMMKIPAYSKMIMETENFIEGKDIHYLYPNFMAFKTKVLLLNGDQKAAMEWLNNYFVTDAEPLELYKIYQYFATAKAYVVLGQTDKAMRYIIKLKQLGTDFCRPLDIAEAGVLQAVVEWASGNKKEARLTLETVLRNMQPYGFIRVISIEGAAILPVLNSLYAKIKKENYQGSLQAHYVHKVTLAAYEQSKRHKGIAAHINTKPIKLSRQQRRIVTLLSGGYKYVEIMEKTGLTIHTVKSHASAAYRKLGVHNAMDAAVRARELGIIE